MADYDDTNSGVLFKNDKEGNDRRPDYTGKINVAGQDFRLAAWIKVGRNSGQKFMSLKVSELERPGSAIAAAGNGDEDLPF